MKQSRRIMLLSFVGVVTACASATEPGARGLRPEIASFISDLPKLRTASEVFDFPDKGFVLFTASYGDPQDCPAGCFYAQAWGIDYGNQIGWIYGPPSGAKFYDVKSSDEFLFDEALWDRIEKEWIGAGFRIMIACDPDTPTRSLERLAARLPVDGWPYLAELLLEVAQLRDVRPVVETIAALGPSTYNYSGPRQHAASLLANWPSQPTTRHFCLAGT
ncbi:MAG TPA: hypothetical protein VJ865_15610 [Gemmatimonadaceae bacterium]|nr:hypothetical protein [Gemmatimonadaceae bacterium]